MAQILALQAEGVPLAPVVADAAYGTSFEFRETLTAQGIPCVLGVREDTTVWSPGVTPRAPRRRRRRGRAPTRLHHPAGHGPVHLTTLVSRLPLAAWATVIWREGTRGSMRSRFVALRIRPAHDRAGEPPPIEWVLSEWPLSEPAPTKPGGQTVWVRRDIAPTMLVEVWDIGGDGAVARRYQSSAPWMWREDLAFSGEQFWWDDDA